VYPTLAQRAAMDPGVRTFMAIYDADGSVTSWSGGDMDDRIFREMYSYLGHTHRLRKQIAKMEKTPQTKTKRRRRHRALLRNFSLCETLSTTCSTTSSRGSLTLSRSFLSLGLKCPAWLRRRAASSARRPYAECTIGDTTSSCSGYWPRRSWCLGAPSSNVTSHTHPRHVVRVDLSTRTWTGARFLLAEIAGTGRRIRREKYHTPLPHHP